MTRNPYSTAGLAMLSALGLAPRAAAQLPGAPREPTTAPRTDRSLFESLAFYATLGVYGVRTGAVINEAAGLGASRDPLARTLVPALVGGAGVVIALALDHPRHIRRGRGFAVAAGVTLGGLSMSALGFLRGDGRRFRGDPLSSSLVWLGSTAGLTAGLLAGELLDPTAGSGTLVVTFGVGGALSGAALCGITGCGHDLGYYVFAGELALTSAAVAAIGLVHPSESEVRWTVLGALVGALPGALTLTFGPRSALQFNGEGRAGFAISLGGLLVGGIGSLALARALRGSSSRRAASSGAHNPVPTLSVGSGSILLGVALSL